MVHVHLNDLGQGNSRNLLLDEAALPDYFSEEHLKQLDRHFQTREQLLQALNDSPEPPEEGMDQTAESSIHAKARHLLIKLMIK